MTRAILTISTIAAGLLAGCTATPHPSAVVSATVPLTHQQEIVPQSDPASMGGPAVATPSGTVAPSGTAMSQFTSTPVAGLPQCSQYSATATIDGKKQLLNGEACQQPDGSWHIAEQPAGSTVVYQTAYWPAAGDVAYDACFDDPFTSPCLYDFPFGFSIGFPVFIDIHHHFHHFVYTGQFHHFGPIGHFEPINHFENAGGFHNGFHGGFPGGFHGQFRGGFSGGGFHHG